MRLTVVETSWFTQRMKRRMDDEWFRSMQNQIAQNPVRGKVMSGCGGLRKLRFSDPTRGAGKRGGIRLIYLYIPEANRVDLFDLYGKDEKDDLTSKEKKFLANYAEVVRDEAIRAFQRSGGDP